MRTSYCSFEPSASVTVLLLASTAVTAALSLILFCGSLLATACQIAPVPPRSGKRNVAFGPQPVSSALVTERREISDILTIVTPTNALQHSHQVHRRHTV